MATATIAGPTKFVCAVCDNTKPLQVEGKSNYLESGNGNRICHSCVNARDQKAVDEGKGITLALEWVDGKWFAVNPTGRLRFPVVARQEGFTQAQTLGQPMLEIKGRRWTGRFYPASGAAYFVPVKEKAAPAGGRKATTAKPAAAAANGPATAAKKSARAGRKAEAAPASA
jgi:hypothetical protein